MSQRNNIYRRFPRQARKDLVRWREVEGMPEGEVISRAAETWPDLPAIHHTTWRAWYESPDYLDLRAEVLDDGQLDDLWQTIEEQGGDKLRQGAAYLLMQRVFRVAKHGDKLDLTETADLLRTLFAGERVELARAKAAERNEIDRLRAAHAAESAELQADNEAIAGDLAAAEAEIDRLTQICSRAGLDTAGGQRGELSAAAIKRIRKRAYGIDD